MRVCARALQIYELPAKTWLGGIAVGPPHDPTPGAPAAPSSLDTEMSGLHVSGERVPLPPPIGKAAIDCSKNSHQMFFIN